MGCLIIKMVSPGPSVGILEIWKSLQKVNVIVANHWDKVIKLNPPYIFEQMACSGAKLNNSTDFEEKIQWL